MRVAILTAFWHRPRISMLYWRGIDRLTACARSLRVDLTTVAVVSPDDPENERLARAYATLVARAPNQPLADKWNTASLAAQRLAPDYVLILGSDDLVSDALFRSQVEAMRRGVPHSGLTDFYLYNAATHRAAYWPGYPQGHKRRGRSIGVGRFYARSVLEQLEWALWPGSDRTTGMDGLSDDRLVAHGVPLHAQSSADWGGVALDVKSEQNVWAFDRFAKRPADAVLLRALFPELATLQAEAA